MEYFTRTQKQIIMTIEQKAQRYNEALKKAKKLYEQGTITESLSYVFPELKESEDDMIRKALIDYFDDANKADENPLQSYGIHTDKAIAWLEKQGEKHPKFRIGDTIKKESTGDIVTISEIDLKNREYRLNNTGFIPFKYEHLWELVEQKPIIIDIDKMAYEFAHTEAKGYGMPAMIEVDAYRKGINDTLCRLLEYGVQLNYIHQPNRVEPKFKVGDFIVNDYSLKPLKRYERNNHRSYPHCIADGIGKKK